MKDASRSSKRTTPQKILRSIVDLCADCDTCRPLMEEVCLFFPELYRLWDQECESGVPTDCMSCRLQFNHELPYPVFHPMEILARAYQKSKQVDNQDSPPISSRRVSRSLSGDKRPEPASTPAPGKISNS